MTQALTQTEIDEALCLALEADRRAIVELKVERDAMRATAIDLLEALKACLVIVEDYWRSGEYSGSEDIEAWPEIPQARAAIAKATGVQP